MEDLWTAAYPSMTLLETLTLTDVIRGDADSRGRFGHSSQGALQYGGDALDIVSMDEPERCEGCGEPLNSVVVMVHTADGWKVFHADCLGIKVA